MAIKSYPCGSHERLRDVMRLVERDLSEPYNVFTYRYFLQQWPHLSFLVKNTRIILLGYRDRLTITTIPTQSLVLSCAGWNRIDLEHYAAISPCSLSILDTARKASVDRLLFTETKAFLATRLVTAAVDAMRQDGADEVVLETEVTNSGAIRLYERLGFLKEKRLGGYYLNGVDAFRLKLWLRMLVTKTSSCCCDNKILMTDLVDKTLASTFERAVADYETTLRRYMRPHHPDAYGTLDVELAGTKVSLLRISSESSNASVPFPEYPAPAFDPHASLSYPSEALGYWFYPEIDTYVLVTPVASSTDETEMAGQYPQAHRQQQTRSLTFSDLSTVKYYFSALVVAARSCMFPYPIFAPIGPSWRGLFTGFQLISLTRLRRFHLTQNPTVPHGLGSLQSILDLLPSTSGEVLVAKKLGFQSSHIIRQLGSLHLKDHGKFHATPVDSLLPVSPVAQVFIELTFPFQRKASALVDDSVFNANIWKIRLHLEKINGFLLPIFRHLISASKTSAQKDDLKSHRSTRQNATETGVSAPAWASLVNDIIQFTFKSDESYANFTKPHPSFVLPEDLMDSIPLHRQVPLNSLLHKMVKKILWELITTDNLQIAFEEFIECVWGNFVNECRWYWENKIYIPNVHIFPADTSEDVSEHERNCSVLKNARIDTRWAIAYQKLCLINCCIFMEQEENMRKETLIKVATKNDDNDWEWKDDDDDDDEVFYDSYDTPMSRNATHVPWDVPVREPKGRLLPLHAKLQNNSSQSIYVPRVEYGPFLTSDMTLECSSPSSSNETKMKAEQMVFRDMKAFKAANLDSVFDDFLKWYSPVDIIVLEDGTEVLSERMRDPDCSWQKMWQKALPVPVEHQRVEFPYLSEGHAALTWLANLELCSLTKLLCPIAALVIYEMLMYPVCVAAQHDVRLFDYWPIEAVCQEFHQSMRRFLTAETIPTDENHIEDFFGSIETIQTLVGFIFSILPHAKEEEISKFVSESLRHVFRDGASDRMDNIILRAEDSAARRFVYNHWIDRQVKPKNAEYVVETKRCETTTSACRMFISLSEGDFRVAEYADVETE